MLFQNSKNINEKNVICYVLKSDEMSVSCSFPVVMKCNNGVFLNGSLIEL